MALVGSHATGDSLPDSDIDLYVVRDGPAAHGRLLFKGIAVEWFAESERDLSSEMAGERTATMRPSSTTWATAIPIIDPEGICDRLRFEARAALASPPHALSEPQLLSLRATAESLFEDALRELTAQNHLGFLYFYSAGLSQAAQLLFAAQGRVMPRPREVAKHLSEMAPALEPDISEAMKKISDENSWKQIQSAFVKSLGGPQREFNTDALRRHRPVA